MKRQAGGPAPYGQACMQCFKSKCRCVLRADGEKCERCHRLNRPCAPSDPIRRRRGQKQGNYSSKIARLEGRIDSLVSLLKPGTTSSQPLGSAEDLQTTMQDTVPQTSSEDTLPYPEIDIERDLDDEVVPTIIAHDTSVTYTVDSSTTTDIPEISPINDHSSSTSQGSRVMSDELMSNCSAYSQSTDLIEQTSCLEFFRTKMVPNFPFIYIPADTSVETLSTERPFVLQAICAVAASSTQQRVVRIANLRRIFALEIVQENNSSIDLLLAVMIVIAWSYEQIQTNLKPTLSRLTMLAISIVYDLRLNDPTACLFGSLGKHTGSSKQASNENVDDTAQGTEEQTLEEYRAVLGCFILSQLVFIHFRQIDGLRWTPHMDNCMNQLETRDKTPADKVLAYQFRLQLLAKKAAEIHAQQDMSSPATMLYLSSLHEQLRGLHVPSATGRTPVELIQGHSWYITVSIWDIGIHNQPLIPTSIMGNNTLQLQRMECLWKCVTAIKSVFDIYLAMPPTSWIGFSLVQSAQVSRCMGILLQLSAYNDPAWDRQAVRDTCDLLSIIKQLIQVASLAAPERSGTTNSEIFGRMADNMGKFYHWAAAKLGVPEESSTVTHIADGESTYNMAENPYYRIFPHGQGRPAYGFFGTGEWMERIFDDMY